MGIRIVALLMSGYLSKKELLEILGIKERTLYNYLRIINLELADNINNKYFDLRNVDGKYHIFGY